MEQAQFTTQFWLQQEARRCESDCFAAISRVRAATTMVDVRRCADVHVPRVLNAIRHTLSDYRRLKQVAEQRMAELGATHLKMLQATATAAECKALRGQFLARDWQHLRGYYPRVLQDLDRESQQVLAKKERAKR